MKFYWLISGIYLVGFIFVIEVYENLVCVNFLGKFMVIMKKESCIMYVILVMKCL